MKKNFQFEIVDVGDFEKIGKRIKGEKKVVFL